MAAAQHIPHDIWTQVSQFIPQSVLVTLYSVNRSFYEIATNARYEAITFLKLDKQTKWLCNHLSDPNSRLGDAVRRVEITPWLVKPRLKSYRNQSENLWRLVTGLFNPDSTERQMNHSITKRINKDIDRITNVIIGLRNVREYRLSWDESPTYHSQFFQAFLSPVLTRMKDKLVILSLKVPPEMLRSLVPIALPRLEHLKIILCTMEKPKNDIDEVFDCLTVFVNNLFPSLKSLSLSSTLPSQFLDFTRLFKSLGTFPRLDTFNFSISFEGAHLTSPLILAKFLTKNRKSLRNLQLSTSRCAPNGLTPLDPSSKLWIPTILASFDTPRPRLQSVHLALRPVRADLTPVTDFLRQHSGTLTRLVLTDRSLMYEDVRLVLDSVIDPISETCALRRLHLRVRYLSLALLDLLASRLPLLADLELSTNELITTGAPAHTEKAELDLFQEQVRRHRVNFSQWELKSIGIPRGPSTCPWYGDLERLFLECIPGLLSVNEIPAPP